MKIWWNFTDMVRKLQDRRNCDILTIPLCCPSEQCFCHCDNFPIFPWDILVRRLLWSKICKPEKLWWFLLIHPEQNKEGGSRQLNLEGGERAVHLQTEFPLLFFFSFLLIIKLAVSGGRRRSFGGIDKLTPCTLHPLRESLPPARERSSNKKNSEEVLATWGSPWIKLKKRRGKNISSLFFSLSLDHLPPI